MGFIERTGLNNMSFEHLNHESRKIISSCLTKGMKAKEIANLLNVDDRTISKEIKRNRIVSRDAYRNCIDPICSITLKYPYVCNGCKDKYTCRKKQYKYDSKRAQELADYRLVVPRTGINLTKEEFDILNRKIKDGIASKESIYHIVNNNDDINVSVPTVYRYINNKLLSTSRTDLPYAVTYKKRKKIKEYEYLENRKIDRSNRTFVDYLAFIKNYPNLFVVQMDFLGSIKTDSKSILTLTIADLHFVILFIVEKKNASKIADLFNRFEEHLGIVDFKVLFPCILTDRDPSFSDFLNIEFSHITGEERTHIFYCDAFKSNQKANVENMNKQLRKYFPKGASIDSYTGEDLNNAMNFINNLRVPSLSGYTPNEAFEKVYSKELLDKVKTFIYK